MKLVRIVDNFGPSIPGVKQTLIDGLTLDASGLRIVVYLGELESEPRYLEVFFTDPRGFRYLDEGDLLPYWETGAFRALDQVVFEIKEGGWAEQEEHAGLLNVTAAVGGHREWFIPTSSACLNVVSCSAPMVRFL